MPATTPQYDIAPQRSLRRDEQPFASIRARFFTLEEANRCLPLVRRITRDVVRLARSVRHQRYHLAFLARGGDEIERMFPRELRALRRRLAENSERLCDCLDELLELGIEPEAPTLGLVDFPAMDGDRAICFCWRLDEAEISWWHGPTAGFADRQPLSVLGQYTADDSMAAGQLTAMQE